MKKITQNIQVKYKIRYFYSMNSPGPALLPNQFSYDPFGMILVERSWVTGSEKYQFNYQGSMKDDEFYGTGNSYTTFYRELDVRVGRWLSKDPKTKKTPWESPYISMGNNPIWFNDQLGDEIWVKTSLFTKAKYNEDDGKLYKRNGKEYTGNSNFANTSLMYLNSINSTDIGKALIDELSNADGKFILKDKSPKIGGGGSFVQNKSKTGGVLNIGLITESQDLNVMFGFVGHELFHGYQMLKGNGGASVNSEAEAYLFESYLQDQFNGVNGNTLNYSSLGNGQNNPRMANIFVNSFTSLKKYSVVSNSQQNDFNRLAESFIGGSIFNVSGRYNNFIYKADYEMVIDDLFVKYLIALQ